MLNFIRGLTEKERKETKLVSLLNVPPRVLSYCKNWGYFIAGYASDRYKMQVSCSDLTVQHLLEYFSHKGGKGKLGKVLTAEVRAAMTGRKRTAETCAKISEANTGKIFTAETCAKISEALTGRKLTAKTRAKISETMRNKKRK